MKKIISLILCLILIFSLAACGKNNSIKILNFDEKKQSNKPVEDTVIAENQNYILKWVKSNQSIMLEERATGNTWGTSPPSAGEPEVDELGMPIKAHPNVDSMLTITYLNSETHLVEQALSYTSANKNGRIVTEFGNNKITLEYYFDDIKIMIPVDVALRDDSVAITIDPKKIQENENRIVSISVAPFWCYAENDNEDSYLFYPSGSGAIVSADSVSSQGVTYSSEVYGRDTVMTYNDMITTKKEIRLPVYGAKNNNLATCAIIEKGAESASVDVKKGSTALKFSGVYATFNVRGFSNNEVRFLNGSKKKLDIFTSNISQNEMTIGFYPLKDDSANYVGMAEVYRNYLKKQHYLSETKVDNSLGLTFVGGIKVKKSFLGVPYETVLTATHLKDAKDILTDIAKNTDLPVNVKLMGYGKGGLDSVDYAGDFEIDSKLGNLNDLSKLNDLCNQKDMSLYFDFDLIKLKSKSQGYSTFFDVAYNSLGKLAEGYDYNVATRSRISSTKYNFIKRDLLLESGKLLNEKIGKWNISGISVGTISNIAYSDYSNKTNTKYYAKGNMADDYKKIITSISEDKKIAVSEANDYAAIYSDVVFNAPTQSSQEKIFVYDIPFYEIVFKGYIPMNCEPLNTSDSYELQLLRAVEAGIGLHYVVTGEYHSEFINHNSSYFYGSEYSDLKQKIIDDFANLKEYYAAINGKKIINHSILDENLRKVEFEGGIVVYINFSDSTVISPIGEVGACDFVWGNGL